MKTSIEPNHRTKRDCVFDPNPQPFTPSADWLLAFKSQYATPGLLDRWRKYAKHRARLVGLTGHKIDRYFIHELVQDVLGDTVAGVILWDPERISLDRHVMDALQSRTRHLFVRGIKFRRESIDELDARTRASVEQALQEREAISAERRAAWTLASSALAALRERTSDPEVLLLVDAYEFELCTRAEVLEFTGLTVEQFRAARKRMHRLLDELPSHLRRGGEP